MNELCKIAINTTEINLNISDLIKNPDRLLNIVHIPVSNQDVL
jgi:hypothetical protein